MWRIRIHATYKTGMERICHTCVTNAFEICDEFVRTLHMLWRIRANNSHVWKIWSVNIKVQRSSLFPKQCDHNAKKSTRTKNNARLNMKRPVE